MAKSRYARVAWLLVAAACGMYALQFLVHLLQGESMADSAAAAATAVLALLLVAPFGLLLGSRMGRTQQRLREQGRHHCHVRFPQEPGSPRKWRRRIVTPSANKLRLQPVLGQTSIATGTELTLAVVPAGRYERHPTTRWDRLNVLGPSQHFIRLDTAAGILDLAGGPATLSSLEASLADHPAPQSPAP